MFREDGVFVITADEAAYIQSRQRKKSYPKMGIYTINYFGTKRSWRLEYKALYEYACQLGCVKVADCFGGSGFLSLLASQLNLFDEIYLNELSYLAINYHYVMKNDAVKRQHMPARYKCVYEDMYEAMYQRKFGRSVDFSKDDLRNTFSEFLFFLFDLDKRRFYKLKKIFVNLLLEKSKKR